MFRFVRLGWTLLFASSEQSIVNRHNVGDARYRIPASESPALANMPSEGQGVLIAPRWVITAAHAIPRHSALTDVEPIAIYDGNEEVGSIVKIIGKGATCTGLTDHDMHGPNRTELRRAFNTITRTIARWICYVCDDRAKVLPLEGKRGGDKSGGPALVQEGSEWKLAGLASWGVLLASSGPPTRALMDS